MSAGIGFLTCNCDGANVVNNTNLTYSWEQIGTDVPFNRFIRVRHPGDEQEASPDSQGRGRFGLHWT
jgi:hypothetical protein